jgi:acyl-CoA synthetase (AMP-forming)/AMP-acid ligase II
VKVRGHLTRADLAYGLGMLSPHLLAAFARRGATVSALVEASARRYGDATAVVDAEGELGYRQLDAVASAVASSFERGERIGILCGSSRWLLVAVAAASRAGADAVLVSPNTGATELAGIVARERITRLVRDHDTAARAADPAARPARGGRIVLLSSGTTGVPVSTTRAPLRPAQLATALSLMTATGITRGESVLVLAPLHHGHGLSVALACLAAGAPVLLGRDLLPRAAVVSGVPAQLAWLADRLDDGADVRRVISGSARLPAALASRLAARSTLVDFFGTTETGTLTVSRRPGTVGRPAAGVTIEIVDGAVFARSPLGAGPTGDRGHLDASGNLVLTGRTDALVDSGGENISPSEVEHLLLAHPDIDDAVVRAVPDDRLGQVLSARVATSLRADEVRLFVARELNRAKVPRDIEIVEAVDR